MPVLIIHIVSGQVGTGPDWNWNQCHGLTLISRMEPFYGALKQWWTWSILVRVPRLQYKTFLWDISHTNIFFKFHVDRRLSDYTWTSICSQKTNVPRDTLQWTTSTWVMVIHIEILFDGVHKETTQKSYMDTIRQWSL